MAIGGVCSGCFDAVEILHEGLEPAVVAHLDRARLHPARVGEHDAQARIEEGELAQAVLQRRRVELDHGEGLARRQERHLRAGNMVGRAHLGERRLGLAVAEAHEMLVAVAPDAQLQPFGQRVHHRHADAVQAARHLVGVLVEFSAGMQLGHDDLGRRHALLLVDLAPECRGRCPRRWPSRRRSASPRCGRNSRPAPRRWRCRPPRRPCGAGPSRRRCRRYTCPGACARRRGRAAP